MGDAKTRSDIVMVDLTCRTPPYDRRLCGALQSEGVDVDLWAAGCHTDALYNSRIDVTSCLDTASHLSWTNGRVRTALKAIEYIVNLVSLLWQVIKNSIPLIHFQWLPLLEVMSIELGVVDLIQRQGTVVVYTVHNVLPHETSGEKVKKRFGRIYRRVDALICHTKVSRSRLIEEFGVDSSKIWHIPHGPLTPTSDAYNESIAVNEVVDVDPDRPLVVLFGILRPYKGYDFLLRAWPEVRRRIESAQLAIVGRAKEGVQEEIESLIADLDIGTSVSRTYRYVSEGELHGVIDAADILVYPYKDITQSGALFTGMAAGKAIVATDVGGFPETIRDEETGCIVDYGDQQQLAETLVDLLNNPNRRQKMGNSVMHDLSTKFSWKKNAKKTEECYWYAMNNLRRK